MASISQYSVRAVAIAIAVATAAPAQASPLDLFGFGGRSPGVVGTGIATTTDYDSVYLNPAGLADTPRRRFTIGSMAGDMFLYLDDARVDTETISGMVVGGAVPLPLGGAMRDRVGVGLGFHIPYAALNRARHPLPGAPVYILLEQRSFVIGMQLAAGVRLTPRISAGAGVLTLAELGGTIDVTSDASGRFTSFAQEELITRFTPVAGMRYRIPERDLDLGITFRGVFRSQYDILVTNDLGETLPLTIPTTRIAGAAQYDPLTLAAEASWRWRPGLALVGQLAYQRWSAFPLPTENPVLGSPPQQEPGFHDIVVPRIGIEWHRDLGRTELDLRGGYAFFLSPAPEMDGQQSLLDNHRHVGSAGIGVSWPGTSLPIYINTWIQYHALMPRTHEKDPAKLPADEDPAFDSVKTGGGIVVGGLTMGVDL